MTIVYLNIIESAQLYFGSDESTASFLKKVAPAIRRNVDYGELFFFNLDPSKRDFYFGKDDKGEYVSDRPNGAKRIYLDQATQNEDGLKSLKSSPFGEAYSNIKSFFNGKLLDGFSSE